MLQWILCRFDFSQNVFEMRLAKSPVEEDSRTKGQEVTLVKDQCRLDIRKTINECNISSTDCVKCNASSVNIFTNKFTNI